MNVLPHPPAAESWPLEWTFIVETLSGLYDPPAAPDIADWVHASNIIIPSKHNRTRAGEPFNFHLFPCMSGWIFDFVRNPRTTLLFSDGTTREVENRTSAIMKDSQSTASTCALFALAWLLTFAPGNVIMIIDNRQQARDFAADRLDNILGQFPKLKSEEIPGKSTALAKRYQGGTLYIGGGQSSSDLVSKPAAFGIADEVAKHDLVNEMPTLKLLEGRGTGDDDFRLLAFSTPDNAVEFRTNQLTGKTEEIVKPETILHSSYLQGTRERCEVPCPHCGHYQELVFERLRFEHCKESHPALEDGKPMWNKERVKRETWYQCANPECADRQPDGTVRGKIEERHKPAMVRAHRWVATNPHYTPGHRTMQLSALYNIAFASRTWGAIAVAFLTATGKGGEANLKAFRTEYLGLPFSRYQLKPDDLAPYTALKRGYRRLPHDIHAPPLRRIPLLRDQIRFVGMTVDVQRGKGNEVGDIGHVPWLVYAAGWDSSLWVLDWGIVPSLEELPEIVDSRTFCCKDIPEYDWEIRIVTIDTGYRKDLVQIHCASEGGSLANTRWNCIRGSSRANDSRLKANPRHTSELPARDKFGALTKLRTLTINSDHWESELHIERIAKAKEKNRPPIAFPSDTPDEIFEQMANAEQFDTKPNKHGLSDTLWRRKHSDRPADIPDLLKYALAIIDAVEANENDYV